MSGPCDYVDGMRGALLRGMAQHLNYLTRIEKTVAGDDDFGGTLPTECALGRMMLEFDDRVNELCSPPVQTRWEELREIHHAFHAASAEALADKTEEHLAKAELLSLKVVNRLYEFEGDIKDQVNATGAEVATASD